MLALCSVPKKTTCLRGILCWMEKVLNFHFVCQSTMKDLLALMIQASQKAGNIARLIRKDPDLLRLLTQEKEGEGKNDRFLRDFKTLADVLIQEYLRSHIAKKFPEMKDNIFGEESNGFTNAAGESIRIELRSSAEGTASLLEKVMGASSSAARLLAEEVHREEESVEVDALKSSSSYADVGIWIDPIDATNEYIAGCEVDTFGDISKKGLPCVTILLGAFNMRTGEPLVGVVNQPFHTYKDGHWKGRVTSSGASPCPKEEERKRKVVVVSGSEDETLKDALKSADFHVVEAAGAGYKLLTVIEGTSDAYILSKGSTHFWDTCAPHAILKGMGGGVTVFQQGEGDESNTDISYCPEDAKSGGNSHFANLGGIIAYRDKETLGLIRKCLGI